MVAFLFGRVEQFVRFRKVALWLNFHVKLFKFWTSESDIA